VESEIDRRPKISVGWWWASISFKMGSLPIREDFVLKNQVCEALDRRCMECGTRIFESMGCVVARDFNDFNKAMEEGMTPGHIRERCGLCVEKLLLQSGGVV
jgi:hypothetical protein